MKRPPAPLVVLALALLAVPLVLGGAAPDAVVSLLNQSKDDADAHAPPPQVRILAPASGDGVGRTFTVTGEARSLAGVVLDVQRRVDGGRWESLPTVARNVPVSPFAFDLRLDPGDHLVEVRATDGDAHSLPASILVRVGATKPPTVRIDAPADGAGVASGRVTFEGTVEGPAQRVELRIGDRVLDAPLRRVAPDTHVWRLDADVPDGRHRVAALAHGEAGASLPREIAIAAAPRAPPSLAVTAPEDGAAFGSAGDGQCVSPCVRFTGTSRGAPAAVNVSLDGAPMGRAKLLAGGAWTWELPLHRVFSGRHVASFTPVGDDGAEGVTRHVAFLARTGRTLDVTGDDAPRLTRVPLVFRAEGADAPHARWRLGDAYVGEGPVVTVRLHAPGDHALTVEARNEEGRLATRTIPLYALNRAPEVRLVATAGVAAHETVLRARAHDADGEVTRYAWEFGDGGVAVTDAPEAAHRYAREGVYRVNVTAYDDRGAASARDSALVPVLNAAPAGDFTWTPREPTTLDTVVFTDLSHDPENGTLALEWDFGDGERSAERVATHRFAQRGNHTVTLRVTDDEGGVDLVSRVVRVRNVPPVVDFAWTPENPRAGDEVLFEDRSAKPDGEIVERRWRFDDARRTEGERVAHVFDAPGTHLVTLEVVDDLGAAVSRTLRVRVDDALPTVADVLLEPEAPVARQPVRLQLVAFDLEGNLSEVRWEFGDGERLVCGGEGCPGAAGASNPWTATHAYARSGAYAANVTAVDAAGLEATRAFVVRVANAPPSASARVVGPSYAAFPTALWVDASDPDGRVVRYTFDADGDGIPECDGAAPTCDHAYPRAGTWLALVHVEDDEGGRATASLVVEARMPPDGTAPPAVAIVAPAPGARLAGEVLLRGEAAGLRPVERVDLQLRNGNYTISLSEDPWMRAHGNATWQLLLDTRALPDGTYELVARAVDATGATGFARRAVTVANGPRAPLLTIQVANLEAGALVNESFVVRGTAYHPAGVAAVRWQLDDGPWESATGAPVAWGIPLPDLAPGPHVLRVAAWRGVDERQEVALPFEVPDRRPALHVDVPPAPLAYGIVHAEGRVDGPARVLWRVDGHLWEELPPALAWTLHEPTVGWGGGPHTVSLKAVSLDGKRESPVLTYNVTVVKLHLDPPPPRPDLEPRAPTPVPAWLALAAALVAALSFGAPSRRL